jgi:BirA family biotin operon repressor/biotin-[acetyl-CoA-carboxylase] ligase
MDNPSSKFTTSRLNNFLGSRPFRFFQKISSTNDIARKWLEEDESLLEGAVVVADEQTAGRGRMGRVWETPPGQALAVSMILRPKIEPEHLQRVTMLGSIAVTEAISEFVDPEIVHLKWPNDVQIKERKVCGILAEAVWMGDVLQAVVLGMGINVRVPFADTELAEIATSVQNHTQQVVSRFDLLQMLISRLDFWREQIHDPILVASWRERLTTLGRSVQIETKDRTIQGVASNVDAAGALIVVDATGHQHRVLVGDVIG